MTLWLLLRGGLASGMELCGFLPLLSGILLRLVPRRIVMEWARWSSHSGQRQTGHAVDDRRYVVG